VSNQIKLLNPIPSIKKIIQLLGNFHANISQLWNHIGEVKTVRIVAPVAEQHVMVVSLSESSHNRTAHSSVLGLDVAMNEHDSRLIPVEQRIIDDLFEVFEVKGLVSGVGCAEIWLKYLEILKINFFDHDDFDDMTFLNDFDAI
jgi:hypothetical protein